MTGVMHKVVFGAVVAIAVTACSDAPEATRRVEISGNITAPAGSPTNGKVHVTLFQAWELEGELRHPRGEIESFEATVGPYTHAFEYPVEHGQGLLVYAWQDSDGDGVHCTPTIRDEPAGLVEVQGFPADRVTANVELTQPCAGPDVFYP